MVSNVIYNSIEHIGGQIVTLHVGGQSSNSQQLTNHRAMHSTAENYTKIK